MKKTFQNRLEAINWIAKYARNEGHFEILREQLNFNFIYHVKFFVVVNKETDQAEVVMMKKTRR